MKGGTSNLPVEPTKLTNLEPQRVSTNEQARPVPLVFGTRRVGVTWLSQAFNQKNVAVKKKTGKEKTIVGYNYFCDIAGLVCHGPVDLIKAIYLNDEKVWPSGDTGVTRGAENSITITIPNFGTWTWYWGTETQDFDALLTTLSADPVRNPGGVVAPNVAEEHPAYVGQCYFVARQHFLGYNSTQMQNVEVVVGRWASISWLDAAQKNLQGDCSLAALIVEAMTNHRYGFGLSDADASATRFDRTGIASFEDNLTDEELAISPIVDRVQPFTQFLDRALENVDGYHTATADGKFTLGLLRAVECNDDSLPRFEESDLAGRPRVRAGGIAKTANDVRIKFTNSSNQHKEDSTKGNGAANLEIAGEYNLAFLERPWITRPTMADRVAFIAAKILSQVEQEGTLLIRKSRLQGLVAGGGFYLNYAHYGMCWLHCRAMSIKQLAYEPRAEVQFQVDRGYLATQSYSEPTYTAPGRIALSPQAFVYQRALELPYDIVTTDLPMVGFLAARPNSYTERFKVHLMEGASSKEVHTVEFFPLRGTLFADYSATATGVITIQLAGVDVDVDDEITSADGDANKWIALIDDELFSIYSPTVVATDRYTFSVKRERFDTAKAAHTAGTEAWLFRLADFRDSAYRAVDADYSSGATQNFKLQPIVRNSELDLSAISTQVSVTFSDRSKRPWKPSGFTAPSTYNGASNVSVSWTLNNRKGIAFKREYGNPTYKLEIRKASDNTLVKTLEKYADQTSESLTPANLTTWLGSLVSFKVKLYAYTPSHSSRSSDELTVTKV